MIEVQITLFTKSGKYRPLSTVVKIPNKEYFTTNRQDVLKTAIMQICAQRHTEYWCLKRDGYNEFKARVYDKNKIASENKARYEAIKKERGWA
jgi:LPS sulfotransferase NodH